LGRAIGASSELKSNEELNRETALRSEDRTLTSADGALAPIDALGEELPASNPSLKTEGRPAEGALSPELLKSPPRVEVALEKSDPSPEVKVFASPPTADEIALLNNPEVKELNAFERKSMA
jgi:hypothetical protein